MNQLTAKEAFIAEMLGDMGQLADDITRLKGEIAQLGDDTVGKLNVQVGQLVDAAEKVQERIGAAAATARNGLLELAAKEVRSAKKAISDEAGQLVADAIEAQLAAPTGALAKAVQTLNGASQALSKAEPSFGFGKILLAGLISSFLTVGVGAAVVMMAPELVLSANVTFQNGKLLEKVWPKLSESMQNEILRIGGIKR